MLIFLQVGIPEHVAKILTYPEQVTDANKAYLRQLILNGADKHPGALYHVTEDKKRRTLVVLY